MRGLYAIVDVASLNNVGLDPLAFAGAMLEADIAAIQLRAKLLEGRQALALLEGIVRLAAPAGVPVFMNDRPDLAILAGATGVHVGQGDLRPADVRRLAERASVELRVGLSTHDEAQLDAGLAEPVDYIAIGPVRATASKRDPDPVLGVERACHMARAVRSRTALPTVAIGGIDLDAASQLGQCFDMVAVIGALLPSTGAGLSDVTAKARALGAAMTGRAG